MGSPVKSAEHISGGSQSLRLIMTELLPKMEHDKILDLVSELENERLVNGFVSNYNTTLTYKGIDHIENRITSKGQRFYNFIIQPTK